MSSDPQLDLALSELDDIYNELKDLKNQTTSPKKGEYPSYSTPRNYGSKKETFSDRAHHSSIRQNKSTQRVSFSKHRPMDQPTPQSPTVTSYPEEWRPDSSYDNQHLTTTGDFPIPHPDTPPPVDEYVMRSSLGHCDSDYDEVPDEEEGYAPGSMAGEEDEIPDYDEIPEGDPVALGYEEPPNPYVSMGTLPYPAPRHSMRGEQPFPTYSFVEKKRKETEPDADHVINANNQSSFYDNWKGEDKVDSGMSTAAVVQTTETMIYPELKESPQQNGNGLVMRQKSTMTSQHATDDDDWDEESIPGVMINGKDSVKTTTVVTVTSQAVANNNNENDVIDCTQKRPKHKDGELLCCRLLMSIAIVLMVALLLAALIAYIYFGVDLSGRHPGLGATISPANNGTSGR